MPNGSCFFLRQGPGEYSWGSACSSLCGDFRVQPNPLWCQLHSSEGLCWHRGRAGSAPSILSLLHFMQSQHIFLLSWIYLPFSASLHAKTTHFPPVLDLSLLHTLSVPLLCAPSFSVIPISTCFFLSLFSFPVFILPPSAAMQLQEKSPNNLPAL